jgi:hypothetical protein
MWSRTSIKQVGCSLQFEGRTATQQDIQPFAKKKKKKQQPNTEDNSNQWKQIADVVKYRKKNWVCEGGLVMVKNNEEDGVVQCG